MMIMAYMLEAEIRVPGKVKARPRQNTYPSAFNYMVGSLAGKPSPM